MTTFAFSPQKCQFFSFKKGPRTGLYQSLTQLTAIQFSDHAKSKAQTTSRQERWSTLQMPLAKINYFPKRSRRNAHQFFFTTGWIERFAQSVWIHSRPVSNGDSFQSVFSRMPSLSHPKNHFWAFFSSWRHQRQFNRVWFLHPLPKVKVSWPLFALFSKNVTFFRPKKGSLNRPIPVANASLGGSTFRTPKNRCVKLPVGRTMRGPSISPSQKSIIFRTRTNENEEEHFRFSTPESKGASRKNNSENVTYFGALRSRYM